MGHTPCLASDKSALGDHQRAGLTSTLTIVLNGEVAVNVLGISTDSCERGEDDAVFDVEITNFGGLEKFGGGFRHFECENRYRMSWLEFLPTTLTDASYLYFFFESKNGSLGRVNTMRP